MARCIVQFQRVAQVVTSRGQFANQEQRLTETTMTHQLGQRIVLLMRMCQQVLCQCPRLLEVASRDVEGYYSIEDSKSLGRILSTVT